MLSSVQKTLGWSVGKIRERFCGGLFDGQYFHLNVPAHLANKLSLEQDFARDCITWDIVHCVELACEDAKKETSWLQKVDNTLQSIMKKFTMGNIIPISVKLHIAPTITFLICIDDKNTKGRSVWWIQIVIWCTLKDYLH